MNTKSADFLDWKQFYNKQVRDGFRADPYQTLESLGQDMSRLPDDLQFIVKTNTVAHYYFVIPVIDQEQLNRAQLDRVQAAGQTPVSTVGTVGTGLTVGSIGTAGTPAATVSTFGSGSSIGTIGSAACNA